MRDSFITRDVSLVTKEHKLWCLRNAFLGGYFKMSPPHPRHAANWRCINKEPECPWLHSALSQGWAHNSMHAPLKSVTPRDPIIGLRWECGLGREALGATYQADWVIPRGSPGAWDKVWERTQMMCTLEEEAWKTKGDKGVTATDCVIYIT